MARIEPDRISLTTHHLHMCYEETGKVLSSGTGFVFKHEDGFYMITNWHNVSGKNPVTGEYLVTTGAVPDMISTLFRDKSQPANCMRESIGLYSDRQMLEPTWYEHPCHSHAVDVVALPLSKELCDSVRLFPINEIDFDRNFKEEVSDEAFIIGYPFSDITYLQMPIWKKASIASEPDIDLDQLPKLFVDTATRPGLSGSPVVMQRIGIHGFEGGHTVPSSMIGRIRNFIGVYSGRMGRDELQAQLGIVWKARVVEEILQAKQIGRAPCLVGDSAPTNASTD